MAQGKGIGYGVRQGEGGLTVWLYNVGERGVCKIDMATGDMRKCSRG